MIEFIAKMGEGSEANIRNGDTLFLAMPGVREIALDW